MAPGLDVLQERNRHLGRERHVELARDESKDRGRAVRDDGELYTVEMRQALLEVILVAHQLDRFIGFELDEFERTGADRVAAHLTRRHMAGIDWREAVSEKHQKRRLRPLQMEGYLVIAVRGDFFEVAIPGFESIDAELVARLVEQEVRCI